MARTCSVCGHDARTEVDQAILAGESIRRVARHRGLTESALRRHRDSHLGKARVPEKQKRDGRPHAGSGIDANGAWHPAFAGQRPPLPRNHLLRQTHGAYAKALHLQPRAEEIAAILREQAVEADNFRVTVESAALVGARVEAAFAALAQASPGELRRLGEPRQVGHLDTIYLRSPTARREVRPAFVGAAVKDPHDE